MEGSTRLDASVQLASLDGSALPTALLATVFSSSCADAAAGHATTYLFNASLPDDSLQPPFSGAAPPGWRNSLSAVLQPGREADVSQPWIVDRTQAQSGAPLSAPSRAFSLTLLRCQSC